jgi:hypothetical protein
MPEYCFAFFGHIDTLPLGLLCLFGLLCLLGLPLGLLCLLGYFASWAALPLGLLCLLGLPLGLLCLLGLPLGLLLPLGLYIDTLPLRLCLIDIVCFDNTGILICFLGRAITGHLLVCELISYVNMSNRDTMLDWI